MRGQQLTELKELESSWRERGEADMVERLAMRSAQDEAAREMAQLKEDLSKREDELRLVRAVNERVRAESSEEHGARRRASELAGRPGARARATRRGTEADGGAPVRAPWPPPYSPLLPPPRPAGKLLEAQAKLDHLEEQYFLLSRQNSVLIRSAEAVA